MYDFAAFAYPATWGSLLTLTLLEIVLGIDNIIFISLLVGRLPAAQQARGRAIGLGLALALRVALLLSISWVVGLRAALFTLPLPWLREPWPVSGRDLILLGGGLFLVYKSVTELYAKVQAPDKAAGCGAAGHASLARVVLQIGLIDLVFSFDSVLTAVGLADNVLVMILAVLGAMALMLAFSGAVADFVNKYPSINMLALSFLVLIGVLLVLEAAHQEVEKGYLYFAMAFALAVELLNMRQRRNTRPVPGTGAA